MSFVVRFSKNVLHFLKFVWFWEIVLVVFCFVHVQRTISKLSMCHILLAAHWFRAISKFCTLYFICGIIPKYPKYFLKISKYNRFWSNANCFMCVRLEHEQFLNVLIFALLMWFNRCLGHRCSDKKLRCSKGPSRLWFRQLGSATWWVFVSQQCRSLPAGAITRRRRCYSKHTTRCVYYYEMLTANICLHWLVDGCVISPCDTAVLVRSWES